MRPSPISWEDLKPDTPIRLKLAAQIAFPDGSMTESGLRKEAAKGHLEISRMAGKDYTTLAAIDAMREKCRVQPKAPASISTAARVGSRSWSSETEKAKSELAALLATAERLRTKGKKTAQRDV
jgi:hypothetical protein